MTRVDLDAYIATHVGQWRRLEELAGRRRLTGAESDELLDLYQRVSTHLSVVRSASPDPSLVSYLSSVLARARHTATGSRATTWRDVATFFTATFPAALYRTRRWWLATMVGSVLLAFVVGAWAVRHPEVFTQQMTQREIDAYVGTDFENYYSEFPHHEFATLVWLNNAWVAAQCIALGVLGLPVLWVLAQNVIAVGIAGGAHGEPRPRVALLRADPPARAARADGGLRRGRGGAAAVLVVDRARTAHAAGLARGRGSHRRAGSPWGSSSCCFVSGGIEGFVTPSGLPTWARILIGVVAEALFFAYVFVVGRRAARAGVTGDVDVSDQGDAPPSPPEHLARVAVATLPAVHCCAGRSSARACRGSAVTPSTAADERACTAARVRTRRPLGRGSEEALALEREVVVDEGQGQPVGGLVEHLDAERAERVGGPTTQGHGALGGRSGIHVRRRRPGHDAAVSTAGSATDATTTRWRAARAGSTGSSPSSSAEDSSGVMSTTRARWVPTRLTSAASSRQSASTSWASTGASSEMASCSDADAVVAGDVRPHHPVAGDE